MSNANSNRQLSESVSRSFAPVNSHLIQLYASIQNRAPKGNGAYAYIKSTPEDTNQERESIEFVSDVLPAATFNRTLLTALIDLLQTYPDSTAIHLSLPRSQVEGAIKYGNTYVWAENGWKKKDGGSLRNDDLWRLLHVQILRLDIKAVEGNRSSLGYVEGKSLRALSSPAEQSKPQVSWFRTYSAD